MVTNTAQWHKFLTAPDGENHVPDAWKTFQKEQTKKSGIIIVVIHPSIQFINAQIGEVLPAFWRLVLLKAFRPDRLLSGANQFVVAVFGENFINVSEFDLVKIVEVRVFIYFIKNIYILTVGLNYRRKASPQHLFSSALLLDMMPVLRWRTLLPKCVSNTR